MSLNRIAAVAFILPMLAAMSAVAGGKQASENMQAQERAARKACLTGDYAKGVAILSDLFIETRNATYLFNQGRCFEQNRRYAEAIARFEEYLSVPNANLSSEDRATAEKRIAVCKEKLPPEMSPPATTAPQAFVVPPPSPSTVPTQSAASTPESSPTGAPTVEENTSTSSPTEGKGLRISGIVLASVGVASLATGVLLNLKANAMVRDWETKTGDYSDSKNSDQKNYKTMSAIGYGVGSVCLVTGAVLYGVGYSRASSSSTVAFLPTVGPGLMGAALTGTFQ